MVCIYIQFSLAGGFVCGISKLNLMLRKQAIPPSNDCNHTLYLHAYRKCTYVTGTEHSVNTHNGQLFLDNLSSHFLRH